jgi:hypothetical protein
MKPRNICFSRWVRVLFAAALPVLLYASPSEQQQMKARGCPNRSGSCNMKRSPLVCGPRNCRYQNSCLAELNGFNVGRDCRRPPAPTRAPRAGPIIVDPPPCGQVNRPCTGESGVFLCGPYDCTYSNSCLAELNGFNVVQDCRRFQQ